MSFAEIYLCWLVHIHQPSSICVSEFWSSGRRSQPIVCVYSLKGLLFKKLMKIFTCVCVAYDNTILKNSRRINIFPFFNINKNSTQNSTEKHDCHIVNDAPHKWSMVTVNAYKNACTRVNINLWKTKRHRHWSWGFALADNCFSWK